MQSERFNVELDRRAREVPKGSRTKVVLVLAPVHTRNGRKSACVSAVDYVLLAVLGVPFYALAIVLFPGAGQHSSEYRPGDEQTCTGALA